MTIWHKYDAVSWSPTPYEQPWHEKHFPGLPYLSLRVDRPPFTAHEKAAGSEGRRGVPRGGRRNVRLRGAWRARRPGERGNETEEW